MMSGTTRTVTWLSPAKHSTLSSGDMAIRRMGA
jgi:hypothetical protein